MDGFLQIFPVCACQLIISDRKSAIYIAADIYVLVCRMGVGEGFLLYPLHLCLSYNSHAHSETRGR